MREVDKKAVGQRIKSIRQKLGLTQEEFGKMYGASKGNVATWEKGGSLPNNERLRLISKIGDITVDELLYGNFFNNLFRDLNQWIPDQYKYLRGIFPAHILGRARQRIIDRGYSYGNEGHIRQIMDEAIAEADDYFTKEIMGQVEYVRKNPKEAKVIFDNFEEYLKNQLSDFDSFWRVVNSEDKEVISLNFSIIEDVYVQLEMMKKKEYTLTQHKAFLLNIEEFISSGFQVSTDLATYDEFTIKISQKSIKKYDHLLALYDAISDKLYVVAYFKNGYQDQRHFEDHLYFFNGEWFTGPMDEDGGFNIDYFTVTAENIDFICPILAILY